MLATPSRMFSKKHILQKNSTLSANGPGWDFVADGNYKPVFTVAVAGEYQPQWFIGDTAASAIIRPALAPLYFASNLTSYMYAAGSTAPAGTGFRAWNSGQVVFLAGLAEIACGSDFANPTGNIGAHLSRRNFTKGRPTNQATDMNLTGVVTPGSTGAWGSYSASSEFWGVTNVQGSRVQGLVLELPGQADSSMAAIAILLEVSETASGRILGYWYVRQTTGEVRHGPYPARPLAQRCVNNDSLRFRIMCSGTPDTGGYTPMVRSYY